MLLLLTVLFSVGYIDKGVSAPTRRSPERVAGVRHQLNGKVVPHVTSNSLGPLLGRGPWISRCLGGRRTPPARPRRRSPFRFPASKLDAGNELKYVNGLPVLTVTGTPEEMGVVGVGKLALGPGKRTMNYPHDLFRFNHIDFLWNVFVNSGKKMIKHFPETLLQRNGSDDPHQRGRAHR